MIPAQLGLPPAFAVEDLLTGEHFDWRIGATTCGWTRPAARLTSCASWST